MPWSAVEGSLTDQIQLPDTLTAGTTSRWGNHSTVTDFARFLGWSTSAPRRTPTK